MLKTAMTLDEVNTEKHLDWNDVSSESFPPTYVKQQLTLGQWQIRL